MHEVRNGEQAAKLQAAILRYLADHPHAADTARGIGRFWTGEAGAPIEKPPSLDIVQRALDALVAQNEIACATLADGTRVYEAVGPTKLDG